MRRAGVILGLALVVCAAAAGPAGAASAPPERAVTYDGPTGRFLLDGDWRLRRDRHDRGVGKHWFKGSSTKGWKPVTVPNAWNAGNFSPASMAGSVTWYRKDFRLPSTATAADSWLVRFESTRYTATVWVNGKPVGQHKGGYLPFELRLRGLSRTKVNRLVVRVDNRQGDLDIPPASLTTDGLPNGGWWNYGGLLGDVYLRRVDRIDIPTVRIFPRLACRTCDARIDYLVTVRNYGKTAPITVTSRFGGNDVALGTRVVGGGKSVTFSGSTTVASPHLWWPSDPFLYPVSIGATGAGGEAGWTLESGIRTIGVAKGRLLLNGAPVNFRGGFFHEDSPATGGAADPARMQLVINRLKLIGGTLLRTHYPLDPYFHQLADREGVLIWSEIPVYQMDSSQIGRPGVRKTALRMMRENILDKSIHPSVLTWSMANELAADPTAAERKYYDQQSAQIHRLDPTRPVGLVILGYPSAGCHTNAYRGVDLLGVNTYFGWYPGPNGTVADARQLSPYLDKLRKCYTRQAIANTEFGAEANRPGPVEERGTYAFQSNYVGYTLGVFAKKPWLSGAIGMLLAFHARPGWSGGNPHPDPPMHEKGVFDFRGNPKPAAKVMSDWYHSTQQYDLPGP